MLLNASVAFQTTTITPSIQYNGVRTLDAFFMNLEQCVVNPKKIFSFDLFLGGGTTLTRSYAYAQSMQPLIVCHNYVFDRYLQKVAFFFLYLRTVVFNAFNNLSNLELCLSVVLPYTIMSSINTSNPCTLLVMFSIVLGISPLTQTHILQSNL